jgi:hypothetical protein
MKREITYKWVLTGKWVMESGDNKDDEEKKEVEAIAYR